MPGVLDCIAMGIGVGLEMHYKLCGIWSLICLLPGSYWAQNWIVLLSAAYSVAPRFVESIAAFRLVI